ncbi:MULTISPECIES: rhodanese homology domain-containing protein [Tatumella]|uniref:Rhodanese homology domain-containing protein n=1 Tax=Tatumella punctata TaxID=399969 RepID=A0ABW1VHD8_9GAMM|nr:MULTISPECIES: rhodanese homology domain-containing protein [unclassified Tatumella]MBS0857630.1 rhodanese homology domain-containing protein [Tatumella sp. JGM16]MBS0914331.1 rhodanese homology domain-containing protein [Tatumella sp. JGM91]
MSDKHHFRLRSAADIRQSLLANQELALLDVREEAVYATGHPLFAVNLPLSKLELDVFARIPRRSTPLVVFDNGEGLAEVAAQRLQLLGYSDVALLQDGLQGWKQAGEQLFIDVNSPSKAFGELVEYQRHTPSLAAEEVAELLACGADVKVFDVRRYDEYQTMNIPGSISLPGGELLLRIRDHLQSENTRVVINCAGRTRSIIGTQTLVNAGLKNPVAALRNGTIGWTLAGQTLEHGQSRHYGEPGEENLSRALQEAQQVAARAGVESVSLAQLYDWQRQSDRTTYLFDIRSAGEFAAGHLPGARHVPGGQLVQETDHYASVRGARIVLADDLQTRAWITASWLAQMNWQVAVLDAPATEFTEQGDWRAPVPATGLHPQVDPLTAQQWLTTGQTQILDFTTSANYRKGHIPGAYWLLRADIPALLASGTFPDAERYVVTCGSSLLARFAVDQLQQLTGKPVVVLEGGNSGWRAAGLAEEEGETRLLSTPEDRYRRPYEGTDVSPQVMQAYLEWEYGLVEQLEKDATHGFRVI